MVNSGNVQPYCGGLPSNIQFGDSLEDVEEKMQTKPVKIRWMPGPSANSEKDLWADLKD